MTSENGKENGEMSQGGKKTWVYKAQEAGAGLENWHCIFFNPTMQKVN